MEQRVTHHPLWKSGRPSSGPPPAVENRWGTNWPAARRGKITSHQVTDRPPWKTDRAPERPTARRGKLMGYQVADRPPRNTDGQQATHRPLWKSDGASSGRPAALPGKMMGNQVAGHQVTTARRKKLMEPQVASRPPRKTHGAVSDQTPARPPRKTHGAASILAPTAEI